jgi:hypothetical protein
VIAALVPLLLAVASIVPMQTATLDPIGDALRNDPVHVDPAAERGLTVAEADQLRAAIRDAGTPIFVAVLPTSAAPSADAALDGLLDATGLAGTYAVVMGDEFLANSTVVPGAGALASGAFQRHGDAGTFAVLQAFVADTSGAARGGMAARPGSRTAPSAGGSPLPFLLLAAGGMALFAITRGRAPGRSRSARRTSEAEFNADVQLLRAELSVLADDVIRLEPEVVTNPAARQDYEAATTRFRAATAALDYANEPLDLVRVERVVREAEYAMSPPRTSVVAAATRSPPSTSTARGDPCTWAAAAARSTAVGGS